LAAQPTSDNIAALWIARNQALFRSVNEQISSVSQHFSATAITFVCECADPDCLAQIEMAHEEYDALRQDPTHFAVKPGHVFPEAEVVVEDHGRYVIVEKIGAAGRIAIAERNRDPDSTCPHCATRFTAPLLSGGRIRGFKCPQCRLFVPLEQRPVPEPSSRAPRAASTPRDQRNTLTGQLDTT
jgi:hypothetical protein